MTPPARRFPAVVAGALIVAGALVGCGDDAASEPTLVPILTTTTSVPPTTVPITTPAPPATSTSTSTTSPTTTAPAATTTTTTAPAAASLVLRPDGLGDAMFGADPVEVIAYLSSILGAPTADSGWADPLSAFGVCPGTEVRGVTWGDLGVLFSDSSSVLTGRRHFFTYLYGPPFGATIVPAGMRTDAGIGVGSTVAELLAGHPDAVVFPADLYGPYFVIGDGITGFLTGTGPDDVVLSFIGGTGCGE